VWREKGGDDVRFPDSFIVFTTQTGGSYWVRRATEAQYHKAAKDGYWEDQIDEVNSKRRHFKYVAFCPIAADFDYVLWDSRVAGV
jgi:hypothetical protein